MGDIRAEYERVWTEIGGSSTTGNEMVHSIADEG